MFRHAIARSRVIPLALSVLGTLAGVAQGAGAKKVAPSNADLGRLDAGAFLYSRGHKIDLSPHFDPAHIKHLKELLLKHTDPGNGGNPLVLNRSSAGNVLEDYRRAYPKELQRAMRPIVNFGIRAAKRVGATLGNFEIDVLRFGVSGEGADARWQLDNVPHYDSRYLSLIVNLEG